ncbi:MAG: hypothetical protein ACPGSD_11490 [Flavobacteriales bacterium]
MIVENTWVLFFKLFLILLLIYLGIKLAVRINQRLVSSVKKRNTIRIWLRRIKVVYKPIAVILLLISIISINYIAHGLIFLGIGIFGYSYIKNYLSGVLFKINPLTSEGARIMIEDVEGEIQKFLPLGLIIHTSEGERFMHYSEIDKKGFSINRNTEGVQRQSFYMNSDIDVQQVLDALFDSPLVNLNQTPEIRFQKDLNKYRLLLTLEKGVQTNQIIRFLSSRNIHLELI